MVGKLRINRSISADEEAEGSIYGGADEGGATAGNTDDRCADDWGADGGGEVDASAQQRARLAV